MRVHDAKSIAFELAIDKVAWKKVVLEQIERDASTISLRVRGHGITSVSEKTETALERQHPSL